MKIILFLISMLLIGSCNLPNFEAKPVTIDGLGSLSSIKDKQLNEDEFNKLLKIISKVNRVNEEDAKNLFEIFKQYTSRFSDSSQNPTTNSDIAGHQDVEHYLKLVMDYERLRKPVDETIWQESERILLPRVNFLNPKSNAGSFVGQFMSVYARAFAQLLETNKDKEKILEEKEGETNFYVNLLALKVFEEKAQRIINQNQASNEEKEKAKQFLADIKTYNEAMPADEKILDANDRLLDRNALSTNDAKQINMNRLAQGGINYHNNIKAEEASRRIGDIVQPTVETIELKIKTSYKP